MRVGIMGASSLVGRELAEVMGETALAAAEVVLLDDEEESGHLTSVRDEVALVRRIYRASFEGMDLCFFAGSAEETTKYWEMARDAGAGVVDLTGALRGTQGAVTGLPWVDGGSAAGELDLGAVAVVPAHPVAVMLGLVAMRCRPLGATQVAATVLVPASERGKAGVDMMQQQALSLLSFQAMPGEEFDTQVAFNLVPSLGEGARVSMASTEDQIRADYEVACGGLPMLALQMVHAPVFHGYGVSMLVDFSGAVGSEAVEAALMGKHVEVIGKVSSVSQAPSNVSAAGQGSVLLQVRAEAGGRVWVWAAADNIRLTALHAIDCGFAMRRLRPSGTVQ